MVDHKVCTRCGEDLPLVAFYLRKTGPRAGRPQAQCIACYKRLASSEKVRASQHAYNNSARARAYRMEFRARQRRNAPPAPLR